MSRRGWCSRDTLNLQSWFSEQSPPPTPEVVMVLQQLSSHSVFIDLVEYISLPGLRVWELRCSLALLGHVSFPKPQCGHLKKAHRCWAEEGRVLCLSSSLPNLMCSWRLVWFSPSRGGRNCCRLGVLSPNLPASPEPPWQCPLG